MYVVVKFLHRLVALFIFLMGFLKVSYKTTNLQTFWFIWDVCTYFVNSTFSLAISSFSIFIEAIILVYLYYHYRKIALEAGYSKCPLNFHERVNLEKLVQNIETGDLMNISVINEQNLFNGKQKEESFRKDSEKESSRVSPTNQKCI